MEDPMVASSLTASPSTVLAEISNPQLDMTKTDTNISDQANRDDEELEVSIRLGGILPSDDEDEEDVAINRSYEAGPSSPLSIAETPGTTNTSNSEKNTLDVSLQSQIATLQEIASMESREYQQRLMENSVDTAVLEDHSFIQLNQSLHRFHSVILNLNEENDNQTQEILRLQAQEMESQNKIAQLEAVVSKLLAQNQRLRKKHRSGKSVNRKLVERLHNINNAHQQEEETIDRLLQHEQNLRERCDSSNFSSDFEGFETESVYSMASNRSMVTSEPPTVRFHRERNLTWPHSDFGDDDDAAAAAALTPEKGSKPTEGTVPSTPNNINSTKYSSDVAKKIAEGGKSVSTADVWKASMRPSSPSHNFWGGNSSNSKDHHHDPLHKVDRSNILDLGEYDDISLLRRKAANAKKKKDHQEKITTKKTKKEIESSVPPAFVHDFKVMLDMFKKDDVKKEKSSNHEESSVTATSKRDSSKSVGKGGDKRPSSKGKRESKTSIALDNAKHEAKEAADKLKSSMKNMGKMFNF